MLLLLKKGLKLDTNINKNNIRFILLKVSNNKALGLDRLLNKFLKVYRELLQVALATLLLAIIRTKHFLKKF